MRLKNLNKKLQPFNLFELIGVYLGDGSIIFNPERRIYKFEINGNAEDETYYFAKIASFLKKEFKLNPKIYVKYEKIGKTLRLVVDNKKFVSFLREDLKLNFKNKTFNGIIPSKFLEWEKSKHVIRGLFETDGSIYFTRTGHNKIANYPRIEIKSSSKKVVNQVVSILKNKNFRVNTRKSKMDKATGVYLSGDRMLEKWFKEIGFSKIKTISKHQIYKQLGHYLPNSTLKERLNILSGGSQAAKV